MTNYCHYQVTMSGDWVPWSAKVPQVEVETHKVASPDIVVPTLDTVSSNLSLIKSH